MIHTENAEVATFNELGPIGALVIAYFIIGGITACICVNYRDTEKVAISNSEIAAISVFWPLFLLIFIFEQFS